MVEQKLLDKQFTFSSFDFDPRLARAIVQLNFVHPTLVQAKAIPLALEGKDILARARTGSGKTAAYVMPIIQKILTGKQLDNATSSIKALILVPTRELAEQVTSHIRKLLVYANQVVSVVNIAGQEAPQLQRPVLAEKPDIVVSTPSRACIHLEAKNMDVRTSLEMLVIDEADLIVSFGYESDLRKLLGFLPKIYQSFLMSATFTKEVDDLKQLVLRQPAILKLEEDDDGIDNLTQYIIKCSEFDKFLYAFVILKLRLIKGKIIFFVNDIDRCYKLKLFMEQFSIKAAVLNSELPLNSRYHVVQEFNRGAFEYLVATDEAQLKGEVDTDDEEDNDEGNEEDQASKATKTQDQAEEEEAHPSAETSRKRKHKKVRRDEEYGVSRGVDFQGVAAVINFDFPTSAKAYTHRVGRTARGGMKGMSLSFIVPENVTEPEPTLRRGNDVRDEKIFSRVEKQQKAKGAEIKPYTFEKKNVEGFNYRVRTALYSVSRNAIKSARLAEIKREILNSETLKAHFEDKPKDLDVIRHDKVLQPSRVHSDLKHIPSYLMPRVHLPGATPDAIPTDELNRQSSTERVHKFKNPPRKSIGKRQGNPLKKIRTRR